jgi:hypothetical protein
MSHVQRTTADSPKLVVHPDSSTPIETASTDGAAVMHRGKLVSLEGRPRDIDAITGGRHPKIAARQRVVRVLNVVDSTAALIAPAAWLVDKLADPETLKTLQKNPVSLIPSPNPISTCRSAAFGVEGYMRGSCREIGPQFKQHFRHVKELEDVLGRVGYCMDMLIKPAAKTGKSYVKRYWAFKVQEAATKAQACLVKRWLPQPKGERTESEHLGKLILETKWPKGTRDRKFVATVLYDEAKRVLDKDLDMRSLSEMHELRRTIRWFSILASAMNGAVVLTDEGTPAKYKHWAHSEAATKPFATLPVSADEMHPVKVSRGMWVAMSEMIEELGTLKDNREQLEAVVEVYRSRGFGAEQAEAEALKDLGLTPGDVERWIADAKRIHCEARELFRHITKQLKTQM